MIPKRYPGDALEKLKARIKPKIKCRQCGSDADFVDIWGGMFACKANCLGLRENDVSPMDEWTDFFEIVPELAPEETKPKAE